MRTRAHCRTFPCRATARRCCSSLVFLPLSEASTSVDPFTMQSLIEAPTRDIEEAVKQARGAAMIEASRVILDGSELRVGRQHHLLVAERYRDPRGSAM